MGQTGLMRKALLSVVTLTVSFRRRRERLLLSFIKAYLISKVIWPHKDEKLYTIAC